MLGGNRCKNPLPWLVVRGHQKGPSMAVSSIGLFGSFSSRLIAGGFGAMWRSATGDGLRPRHSKSWDPVSVGVAQAQAVPTVCGGDETGFNAIRIILSTWASVRACTLDAVEANARRGRVFCAKKTLAMWRNNGRSPHGGTKGAEMVRMSIRADYRWKRTCGWANGTDASGA